MPGRVKLLAFSLFLYAVIIRAGAILLCLCIPAMANGQEASAPTEHLFNVEVIKPAGWIAVDTDVEKTIIKAWDENGDPVEVRKRKPSWADLPLPEHRTVYVIDGFGTYVVDVTVVDFEKNYADSKSVKSTIAKYVPYTDFIIRIEEYNYARRKWEKRQARKHTSEILSARRGK